MAAKVGRWVGDGLILILRHFDGVISVRKSRGDDYDGSDLEERVVFCGESL